MSRFYVVCELGLTKGRVLLGEFGRGEFRISEVRQFPNEPIVEDGSQYWNIPQLYQEVVEGLRSVGSYEETVAGISCVSWGGDYLLFGEDGALLTPTYHHEDPRTDGGVRKVLGTVPWETIFAETGMQRSRQNSLFQLAAETGRRFKAAHHLLPIADGFNYLLANVARVEFSQASATQLFNPLTQQWSEPLLSALKLPTKILPALVAAGTTLGPLRPEMAKETRLDEAQAIAACSHELAAALAGLPLKEDEPWAFLQPGGATIIGAPTQKPIVNEVSRDLEFNNLACQGGSFAFYKETIGLLLLEQCQRFWQATDRALDWELLVHLAGSATPFESLIDPCDTRFRVPGDMPLKIQAYCKETQQPVPRKPGAVFRCILESLALLHRRTLQEIEYLTGARPTQIYLLDNAANSLFHHFIANAIGLPVVIAPADLVGLGNAVVQALALGHIQSITEARDIVRRSFKFTTITPQSMAWESAYDRFVSLIPGNIQAVAPQAVDASATTA